jgi:hypothetical protein
LPSEVLSEVQNIKVLKLAGKVALLLHTLQEQVERSFIASVSHLSEVRKQSRAMLTDGSSMSPFCYCKYLTRKKVDVPGAYDDGKKVVSIYCGRKFDTLCWRSKSDFRKPTEKMPKVG